MKRFLLLFTLLLFLGCNSSTKLLKPSFLEGHWIRVNNKPGKKTYEIWKDDFTGIGFTLKEKDTVFKEILSMLNTRGS